MDNADTHSEVVRREIGRTMIAAALREIALDEPSGLGTDASDVIASRVTKALSAVARGRADGIARLEREFGAHHAYLENYSVDAVATAFWMWLTGRSDAVDLPATSIPGGLLTGFARAECAASAVRSAIDMMSDEWCFMGEEDGAALLLAASKPK